MLLPWIVLTLLLTVGIVVLARQVYQLARNLTAALHRIVALERRWHDERRLQIGRDDRPHHTEDTEEDLARRRTRTRPSFEIANLWSRPEDEPYQPPDPKPRETGPTSFERVLKDDPDDSV